MSIKNTKPLLVALLLSLLAFQSQASLSLSCVADRGKGYLTPIGVVVSSTTYELRSYRAYPERQIGSDFETLKKCEDVIRKMKSDRPFVCLPLEQGFSGAVSKLLKGSTYAIFGPRGEQFGMSFSSGQKEACEQVAEKGSRKHGVCVPKGKNLEYTVTIDGKEEKRTKLVFDGFQLWKGPDQPVQNFNRGKSCLAAIEKLEQQEAKISENADSNENQYGANQSDFNSQVNKGSSKQIGQK